MLHYPRIQHQKFSPPPALREYIEHIWTLAIDTGASARREILVPNGRPGFVVCLKGPGTRTDSLTGQKYYNDTIYYSVATRPFVIEQQGVGEYVGVELKPYGLAAFTGGSYAANSVGAMGALFGESSVEALLHTLRCQPSSALFAQRIIAFLAEQLRPIPSRDLVRVATATSLIKEQDGVIKVADLVDEMSLSSSTLRRLFGRYVSTSPEQFIGIIRYASLLKSLMRSQHGPHLLAALHGYYDEAHATKDFKKYTGINKKAFLNIYDGLARIMHEND